VDAGPEGVRVDPPDDSPADPPDGSPADPPDDSRADRPDSPPGDPFVADDVGSVPAEPAGSAVDSVLPSLAAVDPALARRSFLAQPEPLKWTAGAAIALRTGPDPHRGQAVGGSAWTPWMTSKRRPQAAHT
jgi:hypothetical protein